MEDLSLFSRRDFLKEIAVFSAASLAFTDPSSSLNRHPVKPAHNLGSAGATQARLPAVPCLISRSWRPYVTVRYLLRLTQRGRLHARRTPDIKGSFHDGQSPSRRPIWCAF